MKDVEAYLPKSLVTYQRRPHFLWKLWMLGSIVILAVTAILSDPLPPLKRTYEATDGGYQNTNTDTSYEQQAADAPPAEDVQITNDDEPGKYRVAVNGTQIAKLKLSSTGSVRKLKYYDAEGNFKLKTKLKPNEAVNIYDASNVRIGKLKYKKGSYRFNAMGSTSGIEQDMIGELSSLDQGLFYFLPLSIQVRRQLAQHQFDFPTEAAEPDDSDE